jgi:hypothetical protein
VFENVVVFGLATGFAPRERREGLDGASRTNHFEEDSSAVDGSLTVHPGDHGGGVTPVPIPNTAVKPSSADGTVRATWWESRTLPGFFSS